jgi:hypothetical protein
MYAWILRVQQPASRELAHRARIEPDRAQIDRASDAVLP